MEGMRINPDTSKIISNYIEYYNLLNESDSERAKQSIRKALNDLIKLSENNMSLGEHHVFRELPKEDINKIHSELLKFAEEKELIN